MLDINKLIDNSEINFANFSEHLIPGARFYLAVEGKHVITNLAALVKQIEPLYDSDSKLTNVVISFQLLDEDTLEVDSTVYRENLSTFIHDVSSDEPGKFMNRLFYEREKAVEFIENLAFIREAENLASVQGISLILDEHINVIDAMVEKMKKHGLE